MVGSTVHFCKTTSVFSSTNKNLKTVSDVDAGTNVLQVSLSSTHGSLTLGSKTGLSFVEGDGNADSSMSFKGKLADINKALTLMSFKPETGYTGGSVLSILTNDLGWTENGGTMETGNNIKIGVGMDVGAINWADLL
jgi:hypothetical protein